jgi:hypothetical protein
MESSALKSAQGGLSGKVGRVATHHKRSGFATLMRPFNGLSPDLP